MRFFGVALLLVLSSNTLAQTQTIPPAVSVAPVPITQRVQPPKPPIMPPAVLHMVNPEYPPDALKEKISGDVWIGLTVGTDGLPSNIHVLQSMGHGLDEEAIKAVQQYRFRPAMQKGVPVAVPVKIHVQFKIKTHKHFW